MPVSVVIGGQFGSEGKGKVALEIVRLSKSPTTVVRVGGANSGHTGYDKSGKRYIFRQMPAGCIDKDVDVVFPAGSYIDVDILLSEINELQYPKERIFVSNFARLITTEHKAWENKAGLVGAIGSTGSGVGGAVMASIAREAQNFPLMSLDAAHSEFLDEFLCDTTEILRKKLNNQERVIIEGSQGFGLSLLEGGYWPKATSRSTTAAGALAEAGLSPIDVDDVTMVLRSYPIRVAGESGPLPNETNWDEITKKAGLSADIREYTTVTKKLRRVGHFDAELVRRAIDVNMPTRIVLNHLDYIAQEEESHSPEGRIGMFIQAVEENIGQDVDWYGFSGTNVVLANREYV